MMQQGFKIYPRGTDHYRLEYLIYQSTGEFKKSLKALESYSVKRDSILRYRNEAKLSSLQARYESNLKEKEVLSLTQQTQFQDIRISQQQFLMIILVLAILAILITAVLLYRQRKLTQEQALTRLELEEAKKRLGIEQQYRDSELKALRSQMNPHFLFNALNSIQEYIVTNKQKLAGKYLGKFADLMRIYLQQSQVKSILLREEIEALNLYLELEKLRFEESLTASIIIENDIDIDEISVPALLVQPYVENAIKHGLLHKEGIRSLEISLKQVDKWLECIIIDNGIGRKKSMEINKIRYPNHKSFATGAVKSRLELLNYNSSSPIAEEYEDLVDDQGNASGTKVRLRIPIAE